MKPIYLLLAILLVFSCQQKDKKFNQQNYQEQKISLAEKERQNPKTFLKITGDEHRNLFGKTVFNGQIKSTASVAVFKDIRVKLLYYKKGVLVANHEEFFENTISPGETFDFKAKYKTPHGTDSVSSYIMNAKAVLNQ